MLICMITGLNMQDLNMHLCKYYEYILTYYKRELVERNVMAHTVRCNERLMMLDYRNNVKGNLLC